MKILNLLLIEKDKSINKQKDKNENGFINDISLGIFLLKNLIQEKLLILL